MPTGTAHLQALVKHLLGAVYLRGTIPWQVQPPTHFTDVETEAQRAYLAKFTQPLSGESPIGTSRALCPEPILTSHGEPR